MRLTFHSRSQAIKNCWRFIKRAIFFIQSKLSKFIIWSSQITKTEFRLRNEINRYYDDFYLRKDFSEYISRIFNGKLIHLDVGSRGGSLEITKKYSKFMEIIMCEPEKREAKKLREEGFKVIDMPLSKDCQEATFFETRMPAGSSIYRPQGPYLDFYDTEPDCSFRYEIINQRVINCSTLSKELSNLGVLDLDFLKIDTQGAELDVLMGLGKYRPLIMQVEIEYLPLYHNMPNAYQVCQYLFELGYIPFTLTSHNARALCPIWGDGFFMPSWVDPKGIELIQAREEKYIALMLMFGQLTILKFVNEKIKLRNASFIKSFN
ncbi:MAG: FkbM family methyltransferase [Candidatus Omnitrophota bacterium]|nr:FkbM family methyltransferase [Candidatus Omnitrophota bacterium]